MKARFVPRELNNPNAPAGNIAIPQGVPIMPGLGSPTAFRARLEPTRFLVANDPNYVPPMTPGDTMIQGISPAGRTVILTNTKHANLVYTGLMIYPSIWDSQFRAAMVAYLAAMVALPLSKDKKFGMAMRRDNIAIAKDRIMQARITDGNEGFFSSDISTDWMNVRNAGGGRGHGFGDGFGVLGYGWDSISIAGSSAF